MCTTQSRVLKRPWNVESGYSCTMMSPFIHLISLAERKPNTPYTWHFQCTFRTCVQTSSNQDSHVRQLYPKLLIMHKKWRFRDTSASCLECAPICFARCRPSCYTPRPYSHTARMRKIWWKARFRCYLRLSPLRTSNQDLVLRDPSVSKVTHYPQITKLPWRTSRMCSAVPWAL